MNLNPESRRGVGLFVMLLMLSVAVESAAGQTAFEVRVVEKTSEHPWFGQGWPEAYTVDGVQGRTLTLERGVTYTFAMQSVPAMHPFYLSTSSSGAGQGVLTAGVSGNFASGNQTLTFTPSAATPDIVYYQCSSHDMMGGRINVTTSTSVDPDVELPAFLALEQNYPNPFNPGTVVRFRLAGAVDATLTIHDLSGRRIVERSLGLLQPGLHEVEWDGSGLDGRALPSGLYIYHVHAGNERASRVMTLIR
jgi:hypothetical protein